MYKRQSLGSIVKVVEWPDKAKNPIGQVIDILGRAGDNTTERHAILAEFGLPYVYPAAVEKAADKIPAEISAEEKMCIRDSGCANHRLNIHVARI